jgi:hypothetical protein
MLALGKTRACCCAAIPLNLGSEVEAAMTFEWLGLEGDKPESLPEDVQRAFDAIRIANAEQQPQHFTLSFGDRADTSVKSERER